ncbi:MAG: glycosyltransferase family 4 protein [Chloroflexi bacterium]|nr:glycosyltransferase family 4 protein [Chloroflexota bacterium]MBU1750609.1 glycosyltransferase family 4 protein [Chloroflexota bacterium]MBU1879727.1 glycosyltransferase family 4 protein [Chloroflexota bacterium]
MRLLMLNNEYPPIGGGTATANYYLVREFARRGLTVDLVTSTPSRSQHEVEYVNETVTIYRVPIANRNLHYQTERELLTYMVRALLKVRELMRDRHYDLCHAWSTVPAGLAAGLLQHAHGLPYVVCMRGSDVPGYDVRYRWLYPFITPIIRAIWTSAAAATANSWELRQLALRTAPRLPIEVIPNGIDAASFQTRPADAGDNDPLLILCVARLVERKGIGDLLEAVAQIKAAGQRFRVRLVGTGSHAEPLHQRCVELGLEDVVEFVGYIQHFDIPRIYTQADLFVLPSLNEGMPNAVLEAMAAGLPIITTYTGGTSELIRGNGIIVPTRAPGAIAQALTELLDDAALRTSMGLRSRQIAESLGWEFVADRYQALYQRILASGEAR